MQLFLFMNEKFCTVTKSIGRKIGSRGKFGIVIPAFSLTPGFSDWPAKRYTGVFEACHPYG